LAPVELGKTFFMYNVHFCVPRGYREPSRDWPNEFFDVCVALQDANRDWVQVPESELYISWGICHDGDALKIRKQDELVSINIYCLAVAQVSPAFGLVRALYEKYRLGKPELPLTEYWIHSIPLEQDLLLDSEIELCHKLIEGFYWMSLRNWNAVSPMLPRR